MSMSRPSLAWPKPMRWVGIRQGLWEGQRGRTKRHGLRGIFNSSSVNKKIQGIGQSVPWTLASPTSRHLVPSPSPVHQNLCPVAFSAEEGLEAGVENLFKEPSILFWASQNSGFSTQQKLLPKDGLSL